MQPGLGKGLSFNEFGMPVRLKGQVVSRMKLHLLCIGQFCAGAPMFNHSDAESQSCFVSGVWDSVLYVGWRVGFEEFHTRDRGRNSLSLSLTTWC